MVKYENDCFTQYRKILFNKKRTSIKMGVNIRQKGAKAELELCKRLQPFFPRELKRNLEQVRSGGSDVDGSLPFVIECKRVEDVSMGNKNAWWRQVNNATLDPRHIPCVAFRNSKVNWRYLLPASLIVEDVRGWVEAPEEVFLALVVKTFLAESHTSESE